MTFPSSNQSASCLCNAGKASATLPKIQVEAAALEELAVMLKTVEVSVRVQCIWRSTNHVIVDLVLISSFRSRSVKVYG